MRIEVLTADQHPLQHDLTAFGFANPALPSVSNVESALNAIVAVLYPNTKDAVATPLDLPLVGNTLYDYRIVTDDGDGKAAGYRWEQREGDVAAKWYKIYDLDWGEGSVLMKFKTVADDAYVVRLGHDDRDSDGDALAGDLAGQHIYGGLSANTHLTLHANAGDGVGANTGFIQFDDHVRPTADDAVSLGTTLRRFARLYLRTSAHIDTVTVGSNLLGTSGLITDSTGEISFDNENLVTTGTFGSGAITSTVNANTLVLSDEIGRAHV
jgi:hypothetical protein